jgi:hypothetical protein
VGPTRANDWTKVTKRDEQERRAAPRGR